MGSSGQANALRSDNSWLLLGSIMDALSDDEERARSAKRPNPKADPNPDYQDRPGPTGRSGRTQGPWLPPMRRWSM